MTLPTNNASAITAVARVQQNMTLPQFVIGGRNASTYKLDKKTTTYSFAVWRSAMYRLGVPFDITRISFPVYPKMGTNMTIIPVLHFDNGTLISTGTTINSTNFPNATEITLRSPNFIPALPSNLAYDGQTGNFTVGLTITGGTSGATGVIVSDTDAGSTGTLVLSGITGVFVDNEIITDTSTGSATVNRPNYANGVRGKSNFFLELQFTGSVLITVGLPIIMELEIYSHV